MSKEMPLFSARRINRIEDFARFFNSKTYLHQRSALFPSPASNPGLMLACGYKKAAKFARRRAEWDVLRRPVPLVYLQAIGVSLEVLAVAAEADLDEYRAALELPLFPKYGIERVVPGFYTDIAFPNSTSEAEALTIILAYSRKKQDKCCIKFPGLKAVYVDPDGSVSTILFEPRLRVSGGFLLAGGDGRAIGTCRSGR